MKHRARKARDGLRSLIREVAENAAQCLPALLLAGTIVYLMGRIFFGSTTEGMIMVNSVFVHSILMFMALAAVVIILFLSLIPVAILWIADPIVLLRGEKI